MCVWKYVLLFWAHPPFYKTTLSFAIANSLPFVLPLQLPGHGLTSSLNFHNSFLDSLDSYLIAFYPQLWLQNFILHYHSLVFMLLCNYHVHILYLCVWSPPNCKLFKISTGTYYFIGTSSLHIQCYEQMS